ncbi:MAG TPA: hypothetical protein VL354_16625 [Spirochaetia bacterium]|nr:hypothetical protein [Spirochaetia bacterium]
MKADINPALRALEPLAGAWNMELSNASFLPDPAMVIEGSASFEWSEGGDFFLVRQGTKNKGATPWATWLIGRDNDSPHYTALYVDDRRVSRVYSMSLEKGEWKIWREAPGFSQRFVGKLDEGQTHITAYWEKSTDGKSWEHDFDVKYVRGQRRVE